MNLDTLGLTPGQQYDLNFFFAERHTTESNLRFETSIELQTPDPDPGAVPETSSMLMLASAVVAFVAAMRFKRSPV